MNDILLCLFWGCCLSGFVNWTLIGGSVIIASVAVRAILELINKSHPEQTPTQPV